MTTRIGFINFGPDLIKVEVQGRNASGQFTPSYERVVNPGEVFTEYVHSHQQVIILEKKDEQDKR